MDSEIFEVHEGYAHNRKSKHGTVDTIVRGKRGWLKHPYILNSVAQTLQKAWEGKKRREQVWMSSFMLTHAGAERSASGEQWGRQPRAGGKAGGKGSS